MVFLPIFLKDSHLIVKDPNFMLKIMFIPYRRLRLITDTNLSSLLSKGPNYRVPNTLTYSNYKIPIDSSTDNCIEKLKTKFRLRDIDLND